MSVIIKKIQFVALFFTIYMCSLPVKGDSSFKQEHRRLKESIDASPKIALQETKQYLNLNKQTLSLEELHYVQQALRDQADTAYRAGSGALGTKIKDLHKDLTGMMKRGSPAYRKAMFKYADQSAVVDAMKRGSDFFKKGMKRFHCS